MKSAQVHAKGTGYNTLSLVKEAIRLKEEYNYDQTWVVFDKDDFSDKMVNDAFAFAEKNKINVAFSNESFELWYVLHFAFHQTASTRKEYSYILSNKLDTKYEKNSKLMYAKLLDKQNKAIKFAKKLDKECSGNPNSNNPWTTVYKLVIELNKYID